MCYEMTTTQRSQVDAPCTGTSQEVLGPNDQRIGLLLCSHSVVTMTYSFRRAAVAGAGIVLSPGQQPLFLSRCQWGSALGMELRAISSAANATPASVIEITNTGELDGAP